VIEVNGSCSSTGRAQPGDTTSQAGPNRQVPVCVYGTTMLEHLDRDRSNTDAHRKFVHPMNEVDRDALGWAEEKQHLIRDGLIM